MNYTPDLPIAAKLPERITVARVRAMPIECAVCHSPIGAHGAHDLTDTGHAICHRARCHSRGAQRALHARLWPDCAEDWHDAYDHLGCLAGDRQCAWHWLRTLARRVTS